MPRILGSRTSAVAAVVAGLVFASTIGGATAAALITGRQIRNHSIGLIDISRKAQAALHGRRGSRGPQGPPGPTGATGPAGQSLALAYAHVSKAGGVVAIDSKGIAQVNVTRTATGQYCIRGLSVSIRTAVASPSSEKAIGAVVGPATTNCSFVVSTYAPNGTRVDNAFYVQFA